MMGEEIRNAVIERVSLDDAGRGLLTGWLFLDFGGSGQGFGGHSLYLPKSFAHHGEGGNFAGHFIWRCMEIGGVSAWHMLPGKTVRACIRDAHVAGIGHIIKDDWFFPAKDFDAMRVRI